VSDHAIPDRDRDSVWDPGVIESFSLDALEFGVFRELVGRYVSSDLGRAALDRVFPETRREPLEERHRLIAEAMEYLRKNAVGFSGISRFPGAMARLAAPGSTLDIPEIEAIEDFVSQVAGLAGRWKAPDGPHPRLRSMARRLPDLGRLGALIRKAVRGGEVDENYSPALKRIRRESDRARERINRKFEAIIRDERLAGQLQEQFVTERNGRFVVPVRMDQKGRVNGIVHGTSSSGATVFMEPLDTLEMNNDLVRLRAEEEHEVRRILAEVTDRLRESFGDLEAAAVVLADLELVFGIARFGCEFDCATPRFSDGAIAIRRGRHPLLESRFQGRRLDVVPLTIILDSDQRTLVISGPNAGGKTVVLKTIGLFAIMAQCGIPVPASEAVLPVFDRILADIGDRQSIANQLSTFSAHVLSISRMIRVVTPSSLILLDEIGSSTEPNEGAALGVAVLEHFRRAGARTVATTHYNRLKVYAETTGSVRNAAMEFNEETLEPTYRLIDGLAGQSSGLRIAERLDLPSGLIDVARRALDRSELDAARYVEELKGRVAELEAEKRRLEDEKESFEAWKRETARSLVDDRRRQAERAEAHLKEAVAEIRRQAADELKQLGSGAGTRFKRKLERVEAEAGARLRREARPLPSPAALQPEPVARREVRVGMRVRVGSLGVTGSVLALGPGGAEIVVGHMKMRRGLEDLEPLDDPEVRLPPNVTVQMADKSLESNELRLIGKTAVEARDELDKFLDDAFLSRFAVVRVVHGHGMGVLRKTVREMLESHPHVERFEAAPPREGGDGATLAYIRD
jgi:DNA mismatch repair protein MutS2